MACYVGTHRQLDTFSKKQECNIHQHKPAAYNSMLHRLISIEDSKQNFYKNLMYSNKQVSKMNVE